MEIHLFNHPFFPETAGFRIKNKWHKKGPGRFLHTMKQILRRFNPSPKLLLISIILFSLQGRSLPAVEKNDDLENFFSTFEKSIRKVTLDNGLRLIMVKRSYAPTVACYIKFRAGGVDETDQSAGIAHMLEHMLFKGTRQIGTVNYKKEQKYIELVNTWAARRDRWTREELAAIAEGNSERAQKAAEEKEKWQKRLSGMTKLARQFIILDEDSNIYSMHGQQGYNAYTSKDLTNYQIQLPANKLELWARLESDRIQNSVLRDFYTERNVVAEERRMRVDNVSKNLLFETFIKEIYGDHPYGRSLIGSMDSIQNLNYEQAMEFYKTYYAPNNTVITLVGDIDFQKTESLINNYFGNLKSRNIPEANIESLPQKKAQVVLKKNGSPVHILAWTKPVFPDPDDLRLQVASRILSDGSNSRLFKSLVVEKKIAASTGSYVGYPGERYTNLFMIMSVPASGRTHDELEEAALLEIKKMADSGVTEEELKRTVNKLEAEFIYSLRSNAHLADEISYYELITGDYKNIYSYISELKTMTAKDVQESVQKHLMPESVHTARLIQGGAQ